MRSLLCPGTRPRRAFLQSSLVGLWSVTLADVLQMEAQAASAGDRPTGKSIIVLWLWGGPSHMETFDLKPDAPSEFRGEFNPIPTNVSGIRISEHLPKLAKLADRYTLLRTLHHESPGHVNSTHSVLTGYKGEEPEAAPFKPKYPDAWSVINREKGDWSGGVPPYLNLGGPRYNGGAYLGNYLDPLVITGDPNAAGFKVPDLSVETAEAPRVERRAGLRSRFDALRRELDTCADVDTLDIFQLKALSVLTSQAARKAFDLSSEPDRTRDLYGRHVIGQRCLLARRLVEAGARIVTIDFPCVPGQKAFSWDDHASVWNIFEQMKIRFRCWIRSVPLSSRTSRTKAWIRTSFSSRWARWAAPRA
jgi:hypothetical protein